VLRGTRRIFSSVRVRDDGIVGHLVLPRLITDRRIRKAEKLTNTLTYHGYLAKVPSDLGDEFARWLTEARAAGDGAHLTSGAP
jgi:hypothetical protein